MRNWMKFVAVVMMASLLALAGCGGSGSTPPANPNLVKGVAAVGAPLSGTVYLKDSSSPAKEISAPISADQSFSLDTTGLTAPFLLKAVGTANGQSYTLYSFVEAPGTANINPLSHAAIVRSNGGADPATLYAALTSAQLQAIKTSLATVIPQIQALLQQILAPYGVASTNFITDNFVANHLGLDLLLDLIAIDVNNGSLVLTNRIAGTAILSSPLNAQTLGGVINTANLPVVPTQVAGTVCIYPATSTVVPGGTETFSAIVLGVTDQTVTWSVTGSGNGTITNAGVYTAPTSAGTYQVVATSRAAATSGTAAVTVTAVGGSISGTVTSLGSALPGVTVTLTGSNAITATTNASGNYTFSGVPNGSYTLGVALSGYTFTPTSIAVVVNNGAVTGQNFTGSNVLTTGTIVSKWSVSGSKGVNTTSGTITFNQGSSYTYSLSDSGTGTGTWSLQGSSLTLNFDQGAVYLGTATGTATNFTMVSSNGWTLTFVRTP